MWHLRSLAAISTFLIGYLPEMPGDDDVIGQVYQKIPAGYHANRGVAGFDTRLVKLRSNN